MSAPPETLELTLKSSIFDRPRKLIIHADYLEFDDNDKAGAPPTRFLKKEIEAVRFGIKFIHGYRFYIGRTYIVDIRNKDGKIIKLRLKSLYRVRLKKLDAKYIQVINTLFQYYFDDITRKYIKQWQDLQPCELLGVSIDTEGVLFDEKVGRVSWNFLGTKRYWRYCTLYSETDPHQFKAFEYLTHWNAAVMFSLIETILKHRLPQRKP